MTVIETKEKKVTVMSAKPSLMPAIISPPVRAQPPKSSAAFGGYNDAFAQFLKVQTRVTPVKPPEPTLPVAVSIVPQVNPTSVSANVVVQPINQQQTVTVRTAQVKLPPNLPEVQITIVQKKQEDWTEKVLQQTQKQQPKTFGATQRVTTERIQPYVSGQTPIYAIQENVRAETNQQVYYTIRNASNSSPQQRMKVAGQGFEQKQQSY